MTYTYKSMYHRAAALLLVFACGAVEAAALHNEEEIALWGNAAAPGSEGLKPRTKAPANTTNPPSSDVLDIISPTITAFVPKNPNGTSVIVMPGGGYTKLVYGKEGTEIAQWFNTLGITAFVLKYRLPGEGHARPEDVSLQDAQRAIRLLRLNAGAWGLNPQKIGVTGFSAGGHLAALSSTSFELLSYARRDAADDLSARPDFAILVYGVMSLNVGFPPSKLPLPVLTHQPDKLVNPETPPVFMVAANDDSRVDPTTDMDFYNSLRKAGVSAELHIFREGQHGFAISKAVGKPVALWTRLCQDWMTSISMLSR
ncbi:MAG TPA: alpha/beta hydrolase [Rhodocyclaceae bacterium]|nr:alpha/beta hydrolase [Rhodocyclaceae bacterium]